MPSGSTTGASILPPGGALRFGFDVATPANAPLGQIAWNSFGYVATRADNNEPLVPSEPRKVGLEVMSGSTPPENPPGISPRQVRQRDPRRRPHRGRRSPRARRWCSPTGSRTRALLTLVDIVLVDDEIGVVTCPKTTLVAGESMLCTSASYPAISGQYDNVATVTGQPVDSTGQNFGPPLTDTDKGHYTNGELPDTGSSSDRLVQLGGLLLVLGVGVMALGRRRQEAAARPGRARSR